MLAVLIHALLLLSGLSGALLVKSWGRYLWIPGGRAALGWTGMALVFVLGAWIGGRWVHRNRHGFHRPLKTFALVQGSLAIISLSFRDVNLFLLALLGVQGLEGAPVAGGWAFGGAMGGAVLVPTFLTAATFPFLFLGISGVNGDLRVRPWFLLLVVLGFGVGLLAPAGALPTFSGPRGVPVGPHIRAGGAAILAGILTMVVSVAGEGAGPMVEEDEPVEGVL